MFFRFIFIVICCILPLSCYSQNYRLEPRGIVISFDSSEFYEDGSDMLKVSSEALLDKIGDWIGKLDRICTVESGTEVTSYKKSDYNSNWELSLARAQKIVEYLTKCKCIPIDKIRANGIGEFELIGDKIEFVILNY